MMTTRLNPTTTTDQPPSPSYSPFPRTGNQACAACKHQRRRCSQSCPLAPYFPAERKREFHNVHRLFGISNVVKILNSVPEESRDDTMRSIIYEANLRAARPVGGCWAAIGDLHNKIQHCEAELQIVKKSLALIREAKARQLILQNSNPFHVAFSEISIIDHTQFFESQEYINRNLEIDKIGLVQQSLNDKLSLESAEED